MIGYSKAINCFTQVHQLSACTATPIPYMVHIKYLSHFKKGLIQANPEHS